MIIAQMKGRKAMRGKRPTGKQKELIAKHKLHQRSSRYNSPHFKAYRQRRWGLKLFYTFLIKTLKKN